MKESFREAGTENLIQIHLNLTEYDYFKAGNMEAFVVAAGSAAPCRLRKDSGKRPESGKIFVMFHKLDLEFNGI